jgi:hypothetical protein
MKVICQEYAVRKDRLRLTGNDIVFCLCQALCSQDGAGHGIEHQYPAQSRPIIFAFSGIRGDTSATASSPLKAIHGIPANADAARLIS